MHDKKQNWETRRETGKKWGDGTQDEKKWEMRCETKKGEMRWETKKWRHETQDGKKWRDKT